LRLEIFTLKKKKKKMAASGNTREDFDPPIVLGGGLFAQDDDSDDDDLLSAQEVEEEARLGQQKAFLFADLVRTPHLEINHRRRCSCSSTYMTMGGG
jgi:hypothetical protein